MNTINLRATGYHGTHKIHATSISRDGFKPSQRHEDHGETIFPRFGEGSYFYINYTSNEYQLANQFACELAKRRYNSGTVYVKANIAGPEFISLFDHENMEFFKKIVRELEALEIQEFNLDSLNPKVQYPEGIGNQRNMSSNHRAYFTFMASEHIKEKSDHSVSGLVYQGGLKDFGEHSCLVVYDRECLSENVYIGVCSNTKA
ncbi:hypothetical protein G0Q06_12970 [Puniceicoccales bacterium CK1056]|uniref:Uncharacterized protein n=1 Tax=Oceanipulchritudo coccoides TaxID=2706888 RepID=A0A6B2M6U6_9BACT|nr:hypothetical protein [Oceanipulchritudo coccoides]NDV63370.1 hypothetical protein [Oceanipulchritudo coccoides]